MNKKGVFLSTRLNDEVGRQSELTENNLLYLVNDSAKYVERILQIIIPL